MQQDICSGTTDTYPVNEGADASSDATLTAKKGCERQLPEPQLIRGFAGSVLLFFLTLVTVSAYQVSAHMSVFIIAASLFILAYSILVAVRCRHRHHSSFQASD